MVRRRRRRLSVGTRRAGHEVPGRRRGGRRGLAGPQRAGAPRAGTSSSCFVADEETGGEVGAHWLTTEHPDKVRCDYLLNEGGGEVFEYEGRRLYGVCCAEKGIFRFTVTTRGVAAHASLPNMGDNALLKLGPILGKLAAAPPSFELTDGPAALLRGLGADPEAPEAALAALRATAPELVAFLEPMLGVTLAPTMIHASDKINVIPSRAYIKVDCRVPPGLGEEAARARIEQVLGAAGRRVRDRLHRAHDRQRLGARHAAHGDHRPLDQALGPRRGDRAGDPARASRTHAGFARRFRTAWPTASSLSAISRCCTQRRSSTAPTSASTCATSASPLRPTPTSPANCSTELGTAPASGGAGRR